MRGMTWLAILVLLMSMCGCATNPAPVKDEVRAISTPQEVEMGKRMDAQVRSQYQVITGTVEANRVEAIGAKVAAVSDRKDLEYHFALLESDEVNAFAIPGGFVYVTMRLVASVDDDSQLAAVIAHEVGHVAVLHSVRQIEHKLPREMIKALVFGDPKSEEATEAADTAVNKVVVIGFRTQDEYQADDLGVKYSALAGYDPRGLAYFFVKLGQLQSEEKASRVFEFLMSNPNTEDRRQRAEAEAVKYTGVRK